MKAGGLGSPLPKQPLAKIYVVHLQKRVACILGGYTASFVVKTQGVDAPMDAFYEKKIECGSLPQ